MTLSPPGERTSTLNHNRLCHQSSLSLSSLLIGWFPEPGWEGVRGGGLGEKEEARELEEVEEGNVIKTKVVN